MRSVLGMIAATAPAASVAACASDPYYARSNYNHGYYASDGYYYQRSPAPYQQTYYNYTYPQRNGYSSYWDYQRNYKGIHPGPEM